jgi:hypothetical protein
MGSTVPFGQHHQRGARGLKLLDVGIHPTSTGGPEGPRRVPCGVFAGPA